MDLLDMLGEANNEKAELRKELAGKARLLEIEQQKHAETKRDRDRYAGEVTRLQRMLGEPCHG